MYMKIIYICIYIFLFQTTLWLNNYYLKPNSIRYYIILQKTIESESGKESGSDSENESKSDSSSSGSNSGSASATDRCVFI